MEKLLAYIRQHVALCSEEASYFQQKIEHKRFAKGEFALREGQINHYQNFIEQGAMKTYRLDQEGKPHILSFSLENWWSGDLYSFLSKRPSPYYVEALEDSQVIRLAKPALDDLYEQIPQLNKLFRILLEKAFIAQQERIMGNISQPAEVRYLQLIAKYPALPQRVSLKDIALYLGISPQFLSMIRRKIAKEALSS